MMISKDILNGENYKFLWENKNLGSNIILLALGGSRAYGTNLPESDIDIRGIALNPLSQVFGINKDFEQVEDKETDTVVYSLRKMIDLLLKCNPNVVEILGCRACDYLCVLDFGQLILDNKKAFLSKRAIDSFGGYARAQFNRLEHGLLGNGANDSKKMAMLRHSLECIIDAFNIKHSTNQLNLDMRVVSKAADPDIWGRMKHTDKAELFGEDLVISGNFDDYPVTEFKTILSELHKCQSEFGNINKRNTKKTGMGLAKHMMHLIRLYLMGIDLNARGEIITYREKEHDLLMGIRNGEYMYGDGMKVKSEFYDILHKVQDDYEYAVKNTVLPDLPDTDAVNEMLLDIYKEALSYE